MRKADIYTSIIVMMGCAYIFYSALDLQYMLEDGVPGPGFLPIWISSLIFFCMLLQLILSLRKKAEPGEKSCFSKESVRNALVLIGSSAVAMLLSHLLGMLVCLGLLVGYLSWMLGMKNWKVDVALAICIPLIFWAVFSVFLEVQFIQGIFGF